MSQLIDMSVIESLKAIGQSDPEFLPDLIKVFNESVPADLEKLQTCLKNKQAQEMGKVAHGLLSSAQNVGAAPMAEICRQLIDLGRANKIDGADVLIVKILKTFEDTKLRLEEILKNK